MPSKTSYHRYVVTKPHKMPRNTIFFFCTTVFQRLMQTMDFNERFLVKCKVEMGKPGFKL